MLISQFRASLARTLGLGLVSNRDSDGALDALPVHLAVPAGIMKHELD